MDTPQTSAQSLGVESRGLLSASLETQHTGFSRRRSTSVSSSRSAVTVVENNSDIPQLDGKAAIKRQHTQLLNFKIPWWSCLLGVILGPQVTERVAASTAQVTEMDYGEDVDNTFDVKNCPFILTVYVLPSTKAPVEEHQQARCTFDTGCLQGNVVSKEFAQKLGFTSADFKPLTSRESNGGTSATGHSHIPEGAIHLTWYHNSSPRLFSGMRFLVSPSEHFDIVIGAQSILKYKLLSPPNLSVVNPAGINYLLLLPGDKEYDKLRSDVEKRIRDIENKEKERTKPNANISNIDKRIEKMKHDLKIATLRRDLYAAEKDRDKHSKDDTKRNLAKQLQQDLDDALGKPKKSEKSSSSSHATPHIQVSPPHPGNSSAPPHSSRHSRHRN